MSNWVYVGIAYVLVWGALAAYVVLLARRVTQTQEVVDTLRNIPDAELTAGDRDSR